MSDAHRGRRNRTFNEEQLEVLRDIAERIRATRGWSQDVMAEKLGIKQTTYSRFKNGDGTSGTTAEAICRLAGKSLAEIMDPKGKMPTHERFPNRARALQAAELLDLSFEAVDALRAIEPRAGEPEPSALEYFNHAMRIHTFGGGPKFRGTRK